MVAFRKTFVAATALTYPSKINLLYFLVTSTMEKIDEERQNLREGWGGVGTVGAGTSTKVYAGGQCPTAAGALLLQVFIIDQ